MANLYNSEGYFSPTEYEALTKIEKDERAAKITANYRPMVYICSPYSGDTVSLWTVTVCLSLLISISHSL